MTKREFVASIRWKAEIRGFPEMYVVTASVDLGYRSLSRQFCITPDQLGSLLVPIVFSVQLAAAQRDLVALFEQNGLLTT